MKTTKSLSVGFMSLGCAKNQVDCEVIATSLLRAGFTLAPRPEEAEVVFVNTCAFIAEARKESVAAVREACALKENHRVQYVVVSGCLPQRYRARLPELLPEADAFMGVDDVPRAPEIVSRLVSAKRPIIRVGSRSSRVFDPDGNRILFGGHVSAYMKIADGCSNRCAYCAIPAIRGAFRSRSVQSILAEAEGLLAQGVHELNLVAQDTTAYGRDLCPPSDLAQLVRAIGGIGGKFWLRILYGYPGRVSDALLRAVSETPQACRYFDLPVQHCEQSVLQRMNRGGGRESLLRLFARIRRTMPDAALRTTFMVGFPGETEQDFGALMGFMKRVEFDHLGVFVFSPEDGTPAADMVPRVGRRVAVARRAMIMRAQQAIVARKLAAQIGRVEELLVLGRDGTRRFWMARSRRQAPDVDSVVYLRDYADQIAPGMFVEARYTGSRGYDLIAEPAGAVRCVKTR